MEQEAQEEFNAKWPLGRPEGYIGTKVDYALERAHAIAERAKEQEPKTAPGSLAGGRVQCKCSSLCGNMDLRLKTKFACCNCGQASKIAALEKLVAAHHSLISGCNQGRSALETRLEALESRATVSEDLPATCPACNKQLPISEWGEVHGCLEGRVAVLERATVSKSDGVQPPYAERLERMVCALTTSSAYDQSTEEEIVRGADSMLRLLECFCAQKRPAPEPAGLVDVEGLQIKLTDHLYVGSGLRNQSLLDAKGIIELVQSHLAAQRGGEAK